MKAIMQAVSLSCLANVALSKKKNQTPQEIDAKIKAKMESKERFGNDQGEYFKNALQQPQWKLRTGGKSKGCLKMMTGWSTTGGVDSQTSLMFRWDLDPSAAYSPEESIFSFIFASDQHTKAMELSQFTRNDRDGLMVHNYSYTKLQRSIFDYIESNYLLSVSEQLDLVQSRFAFYWNN